MNSKNLLLSLALASSSLVTSTGFSQNNPNFEHWPAGQSPKEIGKQVAWHFVETPHTNFGRTTPPKYITYPETCTWFGALTFAKEVKDEKLKSALIQRFEPLLHADSNLIPEPDHVDYAVFGSIPLELAMLTKNQKYLQIGQQIADKQWGKPYGKRANEDSEKYYEMGLSWETRLWIDDMFMITTLQSQAYLATKDVKYINRAAKEMAYYLDRLQQPNGLFFHAPDAPFYWGRGDGWVAVGMAELLKSLPKQNPDYPKIMAAYQKMMAALLKYQTKEGMWRQLIDDADAWPETSCTGMFTFAMITGVKKGWLDADSYGPAARKGWLALTSYLNSQNDITDVCEGTNKKNDRQYYLDRKRNTGDLHGQAPVLWCATALLSK